MAAVGLAGWFGDRLATASMVFTYRLDFTAWPATDDALCDWLAAQPGVRNATVERDGSSVRVGFTRSNWNRQPQPDVIGEAGRLGYEGLEGLGAECNSRL